MTGAVTPQSGGGRLSITTERQLRRTVELPLGTARITFTSGSIGDPKGVCLSLYYLLGVAGGVAGHLGGHHAGRHLPLLPPALLLENVAGFLATMIAGGTYVALPQRAVGMADPFRLEAFLHVRHTVRLIAPGSRTGPCWSRRSTNTSWKRPATSSG